MKVLLVRHGETEANRSRLALGREDVPLNERGRAQALAVARSVAGLPVAAVYSSPLGRALETARAIAAELGLEVQVEPGLIEMDVGEMEGMTFADMRQRYGEFLREWVSERAAALVMPGGESLDIVADRAWSTVLALEERHANDLVVAVTHNFVILTLLCRALDLPLARFRRLRVALGARSLLEVRGGQGSVLQVNDTCHLLAEGLLDDIVWLPRDA